MKVVAKDHVDERPKITVSDQFMRDMVPMIRRQFCPEWSNENWNMHLWLVKRVVTYPAWWLNEKGLYVTTARYREIFLKLLQDVKVNAGGVITFPPGYLLKCVQDHFKFHADEYNNEGKAVRDLVARVATAERVTAEAPDELVNTLATAHRLIKPPGRKRSKPAPAAEAQGSLL
jgi:hypothetical protein